jgi:NADH-quinone oxidoreductase subunit G
MPRLTINGRPVEVPEGTNLIEAARQAGVEVPHYCYHPGLSVAGQCRLCMVDIETVPRPQIACNTVATEGMVVQTETDRVKETRRSVMEFHLVNHPLDCPVCDQAGECWLQIYYMRHGLYDPRMTDEKVHKPKAVPLGPHVMLDAERCILCSRCVRFCDEVTGTRELGIFQRGDHAEVGLFPGTVLDNPYSGNLNDICPVGALTDRDFRFQVRVWYLDATRSVCPGCARGCNVEVHTSRRRPHHNQGRRVARLKPRYHPDVNRWWLCDAGRYGFAWVDDDRRLPAPRRREGDAQVALGWDEAVAGVAARLRAVPPAEIGVVASARMSNEDLFALRALLDHLGVAARDVPLPPCDVGEDDRLLIRADKNPNTRGAQLMGLGPAADGAGARAILRAAAERRLRVLWVFQHDLLASGWPEAEMAAALAGAETVIFQGPTAHPTTARAHWVLPSAAWVEYDGTVTNFQGRVQRFRQAVPPLGEARPDWQILGALGRALGAPDPVFAAERAEQVFTRLAAQVPAFGGLSYRLMGDAGQLVRA